MGASVNAAIRISRHRPEFAMKIEVEDFKTAAVRRVQRAGRPSGGRFPVVRRFHRIPVLRWLVTLEELLPLYAHSHASMRSAVRLRPQRGSKASLEASIACSPSSKRRVPQNPVGRTGRGADGHAAMAWVHAR